ncbi:protein kinase domain-containing protein [Nocardiopsis dassonvillei]|uniref:protein kinase domain-containing protein n=2 Tax=Nocardiopsis TaxID=2013 RepID=UPI00340FFF4C
MSDVGNGSLVAGFHSLEVLHRGADSTVYRALRDADGGPAVVKVMRGADGGAEVERLCEIAGSPGVVPVLGHGRTSSGRPFVAMDHCAGGDYAARLRLRHPLPVEEVVGAGLAVAGALEAVHGRGLLHHGVEPANLLLTGEEVVLADAGAVLPTGAVPPPVGLDPGALAYAPPEALRGERPSEASDVYRLAATLWTLLSGHPPFGGGQRGTVDPFDHRERVLGARPPGPPRADLPAALRDALDRALAKDPAERFPSAAEFAEALTAPAAGAPGEAGEEDALAESGALPPEEGAAPLPGHAAAGGEAGEEASEHAAPWWGSGPGTGETPADDGTSDAWWGQAPTWGEDSADDGSSDAWWGQAPEPGETPVGQGVVDGWSERYPASDEDRADGGTADTSRRQAPEPLDDDTADAWWEEDPADRGAAAEADRATPARRDGGEPEQSEEESAAPQSSDGPREPGLAQWIQAAGDEPEPPGGERPGTSDTHAGTSVGPPVAERPEDPWAGLDAWSGPPPRQVAAPSAPPVPAAEPPAFGGPSALAGPPVSAPRPPTADPYAFPTPQRSAAPGQTWARPARSGRRRPLVIAAVAASALALATVLVGAVVVLLPLGGGGREQDGSAGAEETQAGPESARGQEDEPPAPPAAVNEEAAPTDVRLEDSGDTVLLTWTDNSGGAVAHHVVGGPVGTVYAPLADVGPGGTRAEVSGLDADEEYCFTVIAVVTVDEVAYSEEACTDRSGG